MPHWGHKEYHCGTMGSGFRSENDHIQPQKLPESGFFDFFTIFQTFSTQYTQKPVEMNSPIKVPYGGTRNTLLGQWKQVSGLEMDKSNHETH